MDELGKEAGGTQVGSIKLHCVLQWESTQGTVGWGLKWRSILMWSSRDDLGSVEKV